MGMRSAHRAGLVLAVVVASGAPASAEVAVPSGGGLTPAVGAAPAAPRVVGTPPSGAFAAVAGRWAWPLSPVPAVEREFVVPGTEWGAGHRGIDLSAAVGQDVLAVEGGVVSHVGAIAGRGTVSVLHGDGLRSTYEPVDAIVHLGDTVPTGGPIGRLEQAGSHCPSACLHLGARRGAAYLDPLRLLRRPRVILLPMS